MSWLAPYIDKRISLAPLATFRVAFGLVMLISIIRFAANGWIDAFYVQPAYHFSYYGFSWIKVLPPAGMYMLFALMGVSALMVMLGCFYRLFIILFFLSFTYVELIDKTYYLNHYYFVSLVSFIMIGLPARGRFSLDAYLNPTASVATAPAWTVNIIKLQLCIVYFFAGLAKLNADWLLEANPLRIWLATDTDLPVVGSFMNDAWVAYLFSWAGALYDLSIPFLLLNKKIRPMAFGAVVVFHLLTWWLFPIGMFPFIMILSTLIFFSDEWHQRLQNGFSSLFRSQNLNQNIPVACASQSIFGVCEGTNLGNMGLKVEVGSLEKAFKTSRWVAYGLGVFMLLQLILPWRYLAYPGNLFWTEEGYRFSWRVMLMEKAGYATFHVTDADTGASEEVYPQEYLTPLQEKMMSTQPDMILQFAHHLKKIYQVRGIKQPEVRVEAFATLNGSGSRKLVDPTVNLADLPESFGHKSWILPMEQDKRGANR